MNERIKKLSEQAYDDIIQRTGDIVVFQEDFQQRFAELIVQECADLCDRFQARDVGMQPAECAGAIRKMFGVEE